MDALTFLGTGGGVPMIGRFHSSILLETGARRFLLDAGEPCSWQLKKLGVPFSSLDAVLLSHGHSDHISGLPMITQGAWLEGRRAPLPIYLPGELIPPLRGWLEAVYLPAKLIGFELDFRAWEQSPPGLISLSEDLRVSVHRTTHLDGLRTLLEPAVTGRFRAYSMSLQWSDSGKRLVYSGDLGQAQDLDDALREPCDLLVCEITHFKPEELFAYLHDKPVRRLCLTHFPANAAHRASEIEEMGKRTLPHLKALDIMADGSRVEIS